MTEAKQSYMTTPPIFDTDVPSNENFYVDRTNGRTKAGRGYRRRYSDNHLGIVAMEQAPIGHGQTSQGIWIAHLTQDATRGPALRLGYHPHAGTSQGLSSRWMHYDEIIAQNVEQQFSGNKRVFAALAGQRLGNYLYVMTYASQSYNGITTGTCKVLRYGPNGVDTRYQQSTNSAHDDVAPPSCPLPGLDRPYDFAINPASGYSETFVSDDATPFLWHTSGNVSRTPAWVVAFRDDGSTLGTRGVEVGSDYAPVHFTGQVGAYAQIYAPLEGKQTFGPYLVFPWAAGHHGPPQLWWLVQVGRYGSTFDVYRSTWKANNYRRSSSIVLEDDPEYANSLRRYPTGNPTGLAFDHDWYQRTNKVGRVGPFPGAQINNFDADDNPPAGLIQNPFFRILREPNRIGQLHIVLVNGDQPIDDDLNFDIIL